MSLEDIRPLLMDKNINPIFWGEIQREYNFGKLEGNPKTVDECINNVYQKHVDRAKEVGEDCSLSNIIRLTLARENVSKWLQNHQLSLKESSERIQRIQKNRETRNKIIKMTDELGVPRELRGDVIREYNMARFTRQPITMDEAYKIIKLSKYQWRKVEE